MVIGPTTFAVILWGAILAVAGIFSYELYTIAREW
jgi:hypothetical protein